MNVRLILVTGLAFLGSAANADQQSARGRAILATQCAACHAVGKSGASPLAKAPAFRDLHRKYNVEHLAESLAEGISTGHPNMPVFVFQPPEINAIISYLKSLEPKKRGQKR